VGWDLIRRRATPEKCAAIRDLWVRHAVAEDRRDIPGLLATLVPDCVYELVGRHEPWEGHAGAEEFYKALLAAFPDVRFELTDIVIGPQGVCEAARVSGTHQADWLDWRATGKPVAFQVVIFFPWDEPRGLFQGERVYLVGEFDSSRGG
jgi:ketosteroid isomerase-like protein